MIPSWGRGALLRVSPAGMDAGGTRHGGRLGARSDHQPTRSATALSVGLKNAAALSKAQIHRSAICKSTLTAVEDRPRTPREWEHWLATTRKTIDVEWDHSTPDKAEPRLIHLRCHTGRG